MAQKGTSFSLHYAFTHVLIPHWCPFFIKSKLRHRKKSAAAAIQIQKKSSSLDGTMQ